MLLSETRTTVLDVEDIEVQFDNYQTIRCDSANRRTGGVVVLIRKDISFSVKDVKVIE